MPQRRKGGKDQGIRSRQEKLFLERRQYYQDGLGKKGHTKIYAKVMEVIGRMRQKYPWASKLYEVNVQADEIPQKKAKVKDIVCVATPNRNIDKSTNI